MQSFEVAHPVGSFHTRISALGGEQGKRPREGHRLAQWGQSVPLAWVFFHCPCDGAGSQLAAWAWGTRRGGDDPPCLLRGQRPALWNTAVGQTQSFHPTWWRGEGTAAGLFPFTGHLLCPRPHFSPLTRRHCLSSCPQKPNLASPISPVLRVRKRGSKRLTLAPGPPVRTVIQTPQLARVSGCLIPPRLSTPEFLPGPQRPGPDSTGCRGTPGFRRARLGTSSPCGTPGGLTVPSGPQVSAPVKRGRQPRPLSSMRPGVKVPAFSSRHRLHHPPVVGSRAAPFHACQTCTSRQPELCHRGAARVAFSSLWFSVSLRTSPCFLATGGSFFCQLRVYSLCFPSSWAICCFLIDLHTLLLHEAD